MQDEARRRDEPRQPDPNSGSQLASGDLGWSPGDFASEDGEAKGYLGDAELVAAMVEMFMVDAMKRRSAAAEAAAPGETESADLGGWLQTEAELRALPFLGKSNEYKPISTSWNHPQGGIIKTIKARYGIAEGTPETVVAIPFLATVQAAIEAEAEWQAGQPYEGTIAHALQRATAALIGEPDPAQM